MAGPHTATGIRSWARCGAALERDQTETNPPSTRAFPEDVTTLAVTGDPHTLDNPDDEFLPESACVYAPKPTFLEGDAAGVFLEDLMLNTVELTPDLTELAVMDSQLFVDAIKASVHLVEAGTRS
jgi:hypothetical protein